VNPGREAYARLVEDGVPACPYGHDWVAAITLKFQKRGSSAAPPNAHRLKKEKIGILLLGTR
jgi:hypothetical protein